MKIQKLPKTKLLKIIEEELSGLLREAGEQEVEEIAARLMRGDPSLSKEEALSLATSAAFRRGQQGTMDYSQKTGEPDEETPYLNLIHPRLEEGPVDATTPEGAPAIPRGRAPTEKQSGIERSTAAILNDVLSRVEELEKSNETLREILAGILRKMGAKI
jgi:hypothetical protein